MIEYSVKKRVGLAILDGTLSMKAALEGLFNREKAQISTLQEILTVRQKRYPRHHAAIATAQLDLARALIASAIGKPSKNSKTDAEKTEALQLGDALCGRAINSFLRNEGLTLRVARAMNYRGIVQRQFNHYARARKFFEAADVIYARKKPLCHERCNNLDELADLLDVLGEHAQASEKRGLAKQLYLTLLQMNRRM